MRVIDLPIQSAEHMAARATLARAITEEPNPDRLAEAILAAFRDSLSQAATAQRARDAQIVLDVASDPSCLLTQTAYEALMTAYNRICNGK